MTAYVLNVNGADYPLTIRDEAARASLWRQLTDAWINQPDRAQRFQDVDVQSPDGGTATLKLQVAGIYSLAILTTSTHAPGKVWGY